MYIWEVEHAFKFNLFIIGGQILLMYQLIHCIMIELEDYLFQKENWMINILQAVGSIGTFIMAILYLISVMIQIRQIKISFIPFLAFDQIIMEQEGKSL